MTSLYLAFHHARWCHVGGLVVRDWDEAYVEGQGARRCRLTQICHVSDFLGDADLTWEHHCPVMGL